MSTKSYPKVPSAPPPNENENIQQDGHMFRLSNITQMQLDMEQELEKYTKCRRKYRLAFSVLSYATTGITTITTALAATGLGLISTGIGAPAGVTLGAISVATGTSSFVTAVASKKLAHKLKKHDAIVTLVLAKLSSFRLIISKALSDNVISGEEYSRLQADYDDYKRQKFDLQNKARKTVDIEAIKKEYLKKGYVIN